MKNKDNLVKRLKARLMDPKLNENFTNRVNKSKNITVEDKREASKTESFVTRSSFQF